MGDVSNEATSNEVVPPKMDDDNSQYVSYETHKKLLSQRKADQAKAKDLEEKYNALLAEKQANEEQALAEQGKFKEMFEKERQQSQILQDQMREAANRELKFKKEIALKSMLGTLKKDDYLVFADINAIQLSDDGQIDIESVKEVAEKFQNDHPHLLLQESASLPNGAPKPPNSNKLSYAEWVQLPAKEQKARMKDVVD